MRLIHNWKAVALRSHSMWGYYLGMVCFNMADILFLALGYDVAAPRFWSMLGNALFIYGMAGRLKDQGLPK